MHEEVIQEEYISVSEFASRVGVSKQAVYQQLSKKLKPYLLVVDGVKKISIRAISDVYGQSDSKGDSKENEQELSKLLIDSLNKQLEEKDRQIAELHRLIATAQMQLTESQHRLQELQELEEKDQTVNVKNDEVSSVVDQNENQKIKELEQMIEQLEEDRKKPWWKKLFNI